MNDQELDQLMRRVLLDAAAQNEQKENQTQEFHASRQYQHEIQKMLRDPLSWAKRRDLNIQPGTTTPCFFIDDGTIFGVCQDKEALSSLYTFTKDNGGWLLADTQQNQEDGCYQDICQSFPEFQMEKNSKN